MLYSSVVVRKYVLFILVFDVCKYQSFNFRLTGKSVTIAEAFRYGFTRHYVYMKMFSDSC